MTGIDYQGAFNLAKQAGATDDEASILAAIAGPESGYNPTSHNTNASTGDNSYGLWQINMLGQMGVNRSKSWGLSSYDQLFDPMTNARAAVSVLRSQGFSAWTAYKNGSYKQYLNGGGGGGAANASIGAGAAAGAVGGIAIAKTPNFGALSSAAGLAGGQSLEDLAKLTSMHGDTLGDRLNAIHSIIMGTGADGSTGTTGGMNG